MMNLSRNVLLITQLKKRGGKGEFLLYKIKEAISFFRCFSEKKKNRNYIVDFKMIPASNLSPWNKKGRKFKNCFSRKTTSQFPKFCNFVL